MFTENDPDGRHSQHARSVLRALSKCRTFEDLKRLFDEVIERTVVEACGCLGYSAGFDSAVLYGAIDALFNARLSPQRLKEAIAHIVESVEVHADGCQINLRAINRPATAVRRSRKKWFGQRRSQSRQLLLPFGRAVTHIPVLPPASR
jgi:hypothetical protein